MRRNIVEDKNYYLVHCTNYAKILSLIHPYFINTMFVSNDYSKDKRKWKYFLFT